MHLIHLTICTYYLHLFAHLSRALNLFEVNHRQPTFLILAIYFLYSSKSKASCPPPPPGYLIYYLSFLAYGDCCRCIHSHGTWCWHCSKHEEHALFFSIVDCWLKVSIFGSTFCYIFFGRLLFIIVTYVIRIIFS